MTPSVKGLSLVYWWRSFVRLYGAARGAELLARLPAEVAEALGAGLDGRAWYAVAWFAAMCAAAREVTGDGLGAVEKVARASSYAEFTGIHRVLVLFMRPQRLLRSASRVFHRYYTHGSVITIAHGTTGAEVRWSGCAGFDENLWHDCFTASMVAVEMCGAKQVSWQILDGGRDGDQHASVMYTWS